MQLREPCQGLQHCKILILWNHNSASNVLIPTSLNQKTMESSMPVRNLLRSLPWTYRRPLSRLTESSTQSIYSSIPPLYWLIFLSKQYSSFFYRHEKQRHEESTLKWLIHLCRASVPVHTSQSQHLGGSIPHCDVCLFNTTTTPVIAVPDTPIEPVHHESQTWASFSNFFCLQGIPKKMQSSSRSVQQYSRAKCRGDKQHRANYQ